MRPYTQGQFDGLCGLYAVLNACQHNLEVPDQDRLHREMFEVGACALNRKRYPRVLWDGMSVGDVLKVARAVTKALEEQLGFKFKVWRPFDEVTFDSVGAYLDALVELSHNTKTSFIMGVDGPDYAHWTVLKGIKSGFIELFDSDGMKSLSRKATSLLPAPNKHRICADETIAFRLVKISGEALYG